MRSTDRRAAGEMNARNLGRVLKLFFGADFDSEVKIGRFKLDYYYEGLNRAFEYDGPDHYCEVRHVERDQNKDAVCRARGILLRRWPYYFQLTKDIAKHFFDDAYHDDKYVRAISLVYGVTDEHQILAPGLHKSTHTPANYVHRGLKRFFREIEEAPPSVRSQVVRSFQVYRERLGPGREWLLCPEDNASFAEFMRHVPDAEHVNYWYPYATATR
jgi:hypothetical protein